MMAAINNEHDIRDDLLCIGDNRTINVEKVIDVQLPCIKMYFYYINLFLLLTCGKTRIVCMGVCHHQKQHLQPVHFQKSGLLNKFMLQMSW